MCHKFFNFISSTSTRIIPSIIKRETERDDVNRIESLCVVIYLIDTNHIISFLFVLLSSSLLYQYYIQNNATPQHLILQH